MHELSHCGPTPPRVLVLVVAGFPAPRGEIRRRSNAKGGEGPWFRNPPG